MILTVTLNPALDHTVQLDAFPAPGEVARTGDATVHPGGKGINVSKYLVHLDAETVATGLLGGAFGQFIADELDEEGIPHDFVEIGDRTRLNTTILTDGEEYKINHDGPTVDPSVVGDVVETIRGVDPDIVVVAGSCPPGIEPRHVDRIALAGAWDTAVDVDGATLRELDAEYALCKPNETELAAATGAETGTVEESRAAASRLRESGFERVVASLGEKGAVMATADSVLHAPALNVNIVDTVGAGDSLLAGVLSELVAGQSDAAALRAGVAVASRVVSVPGTDIPALGDIQSDVERVHVSAR
ncbi:1-phosphofructokinase [Halobacterium noricense]|uniref:1-phosphofructokinase n=1 Tax=Halobacterium noricense TaxID=223182 RepID=UPI001E5CEFE3|nr:1-phosphofructokinase [Halobacterium noricense]UHH24280.1 1-phosphofructokinase family hexose kinase [Halobacterium noricense]